MPSAKAATGSARAKKDAPQGTPAAPAPTANTAGTSAAGAKEKKKAEKAARKNNCPNNVAISLILVLQHESESDTTIRFDDQFIVTEMGVDSMASKRMRLEDRIMAVNGEATKPGDQSSIDSIKQLFERATPCLALTIYRKTLYHNLPKPRRQIVEHNYDTENYDLFVAQFDYLPNGPRYGVSVVRMGAKDVVVSRVEPLSLASYALQHGDQIMDINGTRVSDVQTMLRGVVGFFDQEKSVTMIVKRAVSLDAVTKALAATATDTTAAREQMRNPTMPADALKIAKDEQEKRRTMTLAKPVGVLRIPASYNAAALTNEKVKVLIDRTQVGGTSQVPDTQPKEEYTPSAHAALSPSRRKRPTIGLSQDATKAPLAVETAIMSDVTNPAVLRSVPPRYSGEQPPAAIEANEFPTNE